MKKALAVYYSRKGAVILPGPSIRGHQAKDSYETIAAWAKENLN